MKYLRLRFHTTEAPYTEDQFLTFPLATDEEVTISIEDEGDYVDKVSNYKDLFEVDDDEI